MMKSETPKFILSVLSLATVFLIPRGFASAQPPAAQPPAAAPEAAIQPIAESGAAAAEKCVQVVVDPSCQRRSSCCDKQDAVICFDVHLSTHQVYTPQGVHTLVTIFQAGVSRGIENVAIRAFNSTRTCPDCDQGQCDKHGPQPKEAEPKTQP